MQAVEAEKGLSIHSMKILLLHKRYYMQKDLINDRYGRFYEIPEYLAKIGHQVELVCHSYKNGAEIVSTEDKNFSVSSWELGREPFTGFFRHYRRLDRMIGDSRPDLIIAASDCYQIILGAALSKRHSIPFVADLYDNFAYYRASWIPGVLPLFYRALRHADAITVVSNSLMKLLERKGFATDRLYLVENAVAGKFCSNYDRQSSRDQFGFEAGRIYIGTAGELSRARGVEVLIRAFSEIAAENPSMSLVLAGKKEKGLKIPDSSNIRYLGMLDHDEIPVLFSALDLGVVCVGDNEFGRYCFPQKFYEMIACGLPVIASAVGEMLSLLKDNPEQLFRPDDKENMKLAIREQLRNRHRPSLTVPTWETQAKKIDGVIRNIVSRARPDPTRVG